MKNRVQILSELQKFQRPTERFLSVSVQHWVLRITRQIEQKTEMNQSEDCISSMEDKRLYKTTLGFLLPWLGRGVVGEVRERRLHERKGTQNNLNRARKATRPSAVNILRVERSDRVNRVYQFLRECWWCDVTSGQRMILIEDRRERLISECFGKGKSSSDDLWIVWNTSSLQSKKAMKIWLVLWSASSEGSELHCRK